MVHRCVICHSNSKNNDLSFHQFPKDNEKKEIWISILNIKQHIKDLNRLCSLHFCQSSYTFCDEKKILRSDAVLIRSNNLAMPTDISDVSSHIPPTINDSFIEIDYDNDPSCHIPGCIKYNLLDTSTEISIPTDVSDVSSHTPPKINKRSFEAENVITTSPTKKKIYSSSRIGDLDEDNFATPRRRKRNLTLVKNSVTNLRWKYKILKQRNSRLENKITTLNGIINELRSKSMISENAAINLEAMGSDVLENIVKEAISGKKCSSPKEICEFSITLQYYSPRAYSFVRKSFANVLPHPRTLRRWYTVVDGKPGFTLEAFEIIKQKVASDTHVYCNITVDEMCVKHHLESDTHQNVYGHINMGTDIIYNCDDDEIQLAKNALVFLVVGLNGYWKLPIGYFLIDSLNGEERDNLLSKAMNLITETGVHLHSVTFDGASVNLSMYASLGADFNTRVPYIKNPSSNEKMFVFLDPAHMIKLIRNTLGDKKNLRNGDGKLIKWTFIEMLYEKEQKEGLRLATKLTSRHVYYRNEIMNVRLASQVLSNSVGDALLYLKNENKEFNECEATSEFCYMINNAFDIMNSRKLYSTNPFNNAIYAKTFANKFTKYVEDLELENKIKIVLSKRKTGFKGLIMGLHSALELYKILISKKHLTFVITYKLRQDHLETFFSAVRSHGGYNNNPTCRQFQAAYKRLLIHNSIIGSLHGNCTILGNTKTLSMTNIVKNYTEHNMTEYHDHDYFNSIKRVNSYTEDVSVYIAGFVEMKLEKKVACEICKSSLTIMSQKSKLALIKDRGGLKKHSKSLQTVCIEAENVYRQYSVDFINKKRKINEFIVKVKSMLYQKYSIFTDMACVNYEYNTLFEQSQQFNTHRDNLIRAICQIYFNIRFFHEIRKSNDNIKMRAKLTKLIHFRHE